MERLKSTSPSDMAVKPKTILDLPPEIRNRIYEQTFATSQLWIFSANVHFRIVIKPDMPAVINTRQQISQESLSIFFSSQTFLMSLAIFEDLRLSQRGRVAMKHMNELTIREYPSECMGGVPFKVCARVQKGILETTCMPYPWPGCTCSIEEAVQDEATRRMEEGESERGLAYIAVECFRDDHLPYLAGRSAYDHVCEVCGEGVQKYKIGAEWAVSGASASALMKAVPSRVSEVKLISKRTARANTSLATIAAKLIWTLRRGRKSTSAAA
ncbi:hypothetical protein LTR56_015146 [Elasticomyces elasticus]|nr:hypothetical protein LTR56_015146 [Elasticomyces elasticus]KAK3651988.1 hypothetical protein LTR22_011918 [Elasticomyces elasticus]KAK4919059.1 hypothetical protein LTR49_013230 [Elasticomyces elasticus]KAK5765709.1 hypothetical protein LTS12_004215 [Elasticomyces elasticus]